MLPFSVRRSLLTVASVFVRFQPNWDVRGKFERSRPLKAAGSVCTHHTHSAHHTPHNTPYTHRLFIPEQANEVSKISSSRRRSRRRRSFGADGGTVGGSAYDRILIFFAWACGTERLQSSSSWSSRSGRRGRSSRLHSGSELSADFTPSTPAAHHDDFWVDEAPAPRLADIVLQPNVWRDEAEYTWIHLADHPSLVVLAAEFGAFLG